MKDLQPRDFSNGLDVATDWIIDVEPMLGLAMFKFLGFRMTLDSPAGTNFEKEELAMPLEVVQKMHADLGLLIPALQGLPRTRESEKPQN